MKQLTRVLFLTVGLATGWGASAAEREASTGLPYGVRSGTYSGWSKSYYLEARDADVLAVIVPAVGGRIMHYGIHSQNVMFEMPGASGRTLGKAGDFPWAGGYQCGVTALDASAASLPLNSGEHTCTATRDLSVKTISPADATTGLVVQKDFLMDPENGDLGIEQRVKNTGTREFKGRLWSRTQCKGGGLVIMPVHKSSRLPAGWGLRKSGSDQVETPTVENEMITVKKGLLVVKGLGPNTELVAENEAGWVGYMQGRTLFVQYFPMDRTSKTATAGGTVEVRSDTAMVDLRIMGPEFTLQAGGEVAVPLKWMMEGFDKEATTPEQARARVAKLPPSPFR